MTADPADLTPPDAPRLTGGAVSPQVVPTLTARGVLRRRDDVVEKLPARASELEAEPTPESVVGPDLQREPQIGLAAANGSDRPVASEPGDREPQQEPAADPGDREPQPVGAASTGEASTGASLLDAFRDELGKVADDVIAARAGVSRGTVGAFRRKLGIPAYAGYLFQKGSPPPRREGGSSSRPAKAQARGRAKARSQQRPGRKSQAEAHLHLLGVETDRTVADRAGVSLGTVRAWRRARGIPAASVDPVVPARASAPAPERARTTELRPGLRAFTVVATNGAAQGAFFVVGRDLADACRIAQEALAARTDGSWTIERAELLGPTL